jgi:uracil-DNA glycosylase
LADTANALCQPLGNLIDEVDNDWSALLRSWRESNAGRQLMQFVDGRVAAEVVVFPADVFRALRSTPLESVRVLILGQDPYHGPGQADGLAFSVAAGHRHPPSLRNIFKELHRDLGVAVPSSGSLWHWAQQGVLLLNTSLTVEQRLPASHAKSGWEVLTDEIVIAAARHPAPKVFMLWGQHAQRKAELIDSTGAEHLMLQCNHPSPFSANRGPVPFAGSGVFGRAQAFLNAPGDPGPKFDWALGPLPGG